MPPVTNKVVPNEFVTKDVEGAYRFVLDHFNEQCRKSIQEVCDPVLPAPKAPELIPAKKTREEGQRLLDLLIPQVQKLANFFLVRNLDEMGLLTLEQTINLGYICVWIKVKKNETTAAKILIAIQQKKWKFVNGHEELASEFGQVSDLGVLKPLTSLPANYSHTWIKQFKPTQEGFQALNNIFMNFLRAVLPVFKQSDEYIQKRMTCCRIYTYNVLVAEVKTKKNALIYFDKLFEVYKIMFFKLCAIHNLCKLHTIRVQNSQHANVRRRLQFYDLAEICRKISEISQISLNFIKWSYHYSPISATTPEVAKGFIAQFRTDILQFNCNFLEPLIKLVEKFVMSKDFPDEVLTYENQQQLKKFTSDIIKLLIKATECFEKNGSFEQVEKEYEALIQNQNEQIAFFVKELFDAFKKGLEEFRKNLRKLINAQMAICPYGIQGLCNEQAVLKEITYFKEFLEAHFSSVKDRLCPSTKQQVLMPLYVTFTEVLTYFQKEKVERLTDKYFLDHEKTFQDKHLREVPAEILNILNKFGKYETGNVIEQDELLQPLQAVSSLISDFFVPLIKQYEERLKAEPDSSEDYQNELLFIDEIESRATLESEIKAVAQKKKKKVQRVKTDPNIRTTAPKVLQQPIVTVCTAAVYQHAIGCGWQMGCYSAPMNLHGRDIAPIHRSKHEFLHALHSFQLVHQMLVRSKDLVVQRALAVRFMHQGYLALEQCLNVISTQPKHRLSQMMLEAGVKMDCLWTQNADCGTLVARFSGYRFTNTLPMHQLVESVLKDNDKWFADFHNLLALILEKDPKFSTIQRVRELFKQFQKVETVKEADWSEADLKQLSSLHAKAESLEQLHKQISEVCDKLRTSPNDLDQERAKRLMSIDHHIKLLNDWVAVIKEYPGPQFMLQHAEEALLHALYIADNLGTYLALSKRQVDYRDAFHYLATFRDSYGLGTGLKQEQISVLDDISYIGKGSEMPYSYFTRYNPEEQLSKTMVLLSQLFDLSMQLSWYGEILKSKQKNVGTEFWQHLNELFDLSAVLIKNHLTA